MIKKYFKASLQMAREYPNEAEKSLMALMHFVQQVITMFGISDELFLKSILYQV